MNRRILVTLALAAVLAAVVIGWPSGPILDEPARKGLTTADFPHLTVDAFPEMDQGIALCDAAIRGRNTWLLWTGGSQRFLDWLAREGYGISDLLKMLDSRRRHERFEFFGLMNEPGFEAANRPDEYGLWLDRPTGGALAGRTDAAIAAEGVDEAVYGLSTGVLGLRLFPNPEFDEAAASLWNGDRFYTDSEYSRNPDLVRPYRVGMTCAICHVAPNPLAPPDDPNAPAWENLVSLLGNQYIREGRVFASNLEPPDSDSTEPSSFLWEMLDAQLPGTSDTSRMATDHINNPNAINAIFNLEARLGAAEANPKALEAVSAIWHDGPGMRDLAVPHILKDGADSVGLIGAALRVYVNVGLFSEYWLTLHKPIVGVRYQKPFEVEYARKHSVYWRATEERMLDLAEFFQSAKPYHLKHAAWSEGEFQLHAGVDLLASDPEVLHRGKLAFAQECARCHSSKRPPDGMDPRSDEATAWFGASVLADDFLEDNFLSEDKRHSIAYIGTNACRTLGTNAKSGRIWDNFSSQSYKRLPAVERITIDGGPDWSLAERGIDHSLGYYRTPSLISLWTSAPFLHNNALGSYNGDPSVQGRLEAFEDAAEKLLWPERRDGAGSIWRTKRQSALQVPLAYLPARARAIARWVDVVVRGEDGIQYARLGPVPKGTSINLLANLDFNLGSLSDWRKLLRLGGLVLEIKKTLEEIDTRQLEGEELFSLMKRNLVPSLLENSKCPDLVEDRGHTFGSDLPDGDKLALIEFLKTF